MKSWEQFSQMQHFVYKAAPAVFGVKCVVYGLSSWNYKTLCSVETHNTVNLKCWCGHLLWANLHVNLLVFFSLHWFTVIYCDCIQVIVIVYVSHQGHKLRTNVTRVQCVQIGHFFCVLINALVGVCVCQTLAKSFPDTTVCEESRCWFYSGGCSRFARQKKNVIPQDGQYNPNPILI